MIIDLTRVRAGNGGTGSRAVRQHFVVLLDINDGCAASSRATVDGCTSELDSSEVCKTDKAAATLIILDNPFGVGLAEMGAGSERFGHPLTG